MHRLVLVDVHRHHLPRHARRDRHDVGRDLRVVRRLLPGAHQRVDAVGEQQHRDADPRDEVDAFGPARFQHGLVMCDLGHYISMCTSSFSAFFGIFRKNTSGSTQRKRMPAR